MVLEFLFCILLSLVAFIRKYSHFLYLSIALILILYAGLRTDGADYDHYKDVYENPDYFANGIEFSYVLFSKILPSFTLLLLVYAILGISIKLYAINKLSPFPFLSLLLYFCHYFFLHEMNQSRAGVACGFILCMIYYLCLSRIKMASICFILAFIFHYSAIFCFLFFFIRRKSVKWKYYYLALAGSAIKFFLGISVIDLLIAYSWGPVSQRLSAYRLVSSMGSYDSINMVNTMFFVQIFICIMLLLLVKKISSRDKYVVMLSKIYVTGLICYLLLAEIPALAFRVSELCFITEIVLIPRFVYLFRNKIVGFVSVIIFSFMNFILYQVILYKK